MYPSPRNPVPSCSGYEYSRSFGVLIIGGDAPPIINYPTVEQEYRMKRLGVTDQEVFRCVCEQRGILMSNLGKGEGASVQKLRDDGLDILELKLAQENQRRILRSIQYMVEHTHDLNEPQGRNYPPMDEGDPPQPDVVVQEKK